MRKRYVFLDDKLEDDENISLEPTVKRNSNHGVSIFIGIGVLTYLLVLYGSVYLIDNSLPTPLTIGDEKYLPESFIAQRARNDLQLLTDLGPRITGSYANEYLAVDFLKQQINTIILQANPNQKIELDLQMVSGAYNLDLLFVDQINVYSNVQNVVVKLHGRDNAVNSVLVNSHFDSVPTSPGGSDDGINVAAMLEVLRKLSKLSERPLHNIIFLFNGAEETPLQAAHGFITKHKWAKEAKVVVNLEACGAGGKIILFQTGPETPWLLKYYSRVPHPYGQAAGEEIFQSGWIPSDTDFRIFRDFGGLAGLDMAFYKNGYRYHTKYDDFKNIPLGSFQHVGDNALSLIRNLANAPELANPVPTPGKMVYFDIFGWFMVSYMTTTAAMINLITVLISFSVLVYSISDFKLKFTDDLLKFMGITSAAILGSWVIAAFSVFVIAKILDITNTTMSWYAHPWLILGLYVGPTIGLSGCLLFSVKYRGLSLNVRCHIQAHVVRLIWTIVLLLGTLLNIRTVYALLLPVLVNSFGFVLIHGFRLHYTVRKWQVVYILNLTLPTMILMYQMLHTLSMFIPLTGRIGSDKNPDAIIGLMACFFTILITSPYVALITLLQKPKSFFTFLAVIFATCFVIVFTPMGFPYRGDTNSPAPQRQWLMHTKRMFFNEEGILDKIDSGIFFLNLDRNSPKIVKNYVKDISKAKPLEDDCNKYLLCGLPLSHAKMAQIMEHSTWIPASQPTILDPVGFTVHSKERITPTIIRYNVTAGGTDRLALYLVPKTGMKLVEISLIEQLKQPTLSYNGRQLYFILHTYGKEAADLSFTFDIKVPRDHEGAAVDVAVTANYVHKFVKTAYYLDVLMQFPDWADVTAALGSYNSYIL